MTHTWSVEKIRYVQSTGRITHLHWKLTSVDGASTVTKTGSVYLPDDPTIPFASVTQLILKNWLEDRMSTMTQSEYETGTASVQSRMESPTYITADAPV